MFLARLLSCILPLAAYYVNPILHSDYSDPDVISADGEYWMTSSSFNCVPGLQILHSTNLLDWEIVGAGLPSLSPDCDDPTASSFNLPRHGDGVWAPSIRYFDGKFWIFWGDPDYGIFQIHADRPDGKWSEPVPVWKGKGMIDPCPLLDDDGRVYLVHAWAGSRAGFKSVLCVSEMDRDCTHFIGEQVMVFDGNKNGNKTVEGPKFYKRNGWYYIFAPAGGVKEGWQLVLRSRNVYGPYEYRKVLHQGDTDIHGPHQGALVEDADGKGWFLHFEDRYAYGRVVHLQPLEWLDDGWCKIGVDRNGDGIGEPVESFRAPAPYPDKPSAVKAVPALCSATDFDGVSIPLNWQWHSNPSAGWALLNPSDGCLRLNCARQPDSWHNLWGTPNLLLEKISGEKMSLHTRLVFRPSHTGDRAGVVVMGLDYSTIEFFVEGERVKLRRILCKDADKGTAEDISDAIDAGPACGFISADIMVTVSRGCICEFRYRLDGKGPYKTLGLPFKAREGKWIGAKVGFFAVSFSDGNDCSYIEVY